MYGRPAASAKLCPIRARPFTAIPSFDLVWRIPSFDALASFCHRMLRTLDMQDQIIAQRTLLTDVLHSVAAVLSFSTVKVKILDVQGELGGTGVGKMSVYSECSLRSDSKPRSLSPGNVASSLEPEDVEAFRRSSRCRGSSGSGSGIGCSWKTPLTCLPHRLMSWPVPVPSITLWCTQRQTKS